MLFALAAFSFVLANTEKNFTIRVISESLGAVSLPTASFIVFLSLSLFWYLSELLSSFFSSAADAAFFHAVLSSL